MPQIQPREKLLETRYFPKTGVHFIPLTVVLSRRYDMNAALDYFIGLRQENLTWTGYPRAMSVGNYKHFTVTHGRFQQAGNDLV
jgi:hypothetical protein